jgi:DNA segregation ATPase FtsK/SpoIIIE-like protein
VKVKPYELFAGVDIKGEPIIFNVNITPHVLNAGQTRKGKTAAMDMMLISLIYSCNENEIELYLFQCAKSDLI